MNSQRLGSVFLCFLGLSGWISSCRTFTSPEGGSQPSAMILNGTRTPVSEPRLLQAVGALADAGNKAKCTAFFVAEDTVVTARHCVHPPQSPTADTGTATSAVALDQLSLTTQAGTFKFSEIKKESAGADIVFLTTTTKNATFLSPGAVDPNLPLNVVGVDPSTAQLVNGPGSVLSNDSDQSFLAYRNDTDLGTSGGAVLQNGTLVAVHLGFFIDRKFSADFAVLQTPQALPPSVGKGDQIKKEVIVTNTSRAQQQGVLGNLGVIFSAIDGADTKKFLGGEIHPENNSDIQVQNATANDIYVAFKLEKLSWFQGNCAAETIYVGFFHVPAGSGRYISTGYDREGGGYMAAVVDTNDRYFWWTAPYKIVSSSHCSRSGGILTNQLYAVKCDNESGKMSPYIWEDISSKGKTFNFSTIIGGQNGGGIVVQ